MYLLKKTNKERAELSFSTVEEVKQQETALFALIKTSLSSSCVSHRKCCCSPKLSLLCLSPFSEGVVLCQLHSLL